MRNFFKRLLPILPFLGIFTTVLILFFTNYKPGTFLTGWDNLHPEFNFALNLQRSIFAVWQEYQGLGLLGGMGHAADLIHVLTTGLISIAFPIDMARYVWTFLMLFLGGTGAYFFLKKHILPEEDTMLPAFLGALFYLLNLATLQTFYAPFEAFIAHFSSLPWLFLTSLSFVKIPNTKNALLLSLVLLLASPAAYIPTLFVVYILSLFILLGINYVNSQAKTKLLRAVSKLFGIITAINAFWLLPFLYFTVTNAGTNVTSKINQMATDTIFAQNKEFGTLSDVMLLKGFWFQNIDLNFAGDRTFMLAPLRAHYNNPWVILVGFLLFGLVATGVFISLKKKNKALYPFIGLFLFAFTMLATATIPFSWFDTIFREIPLFNQAFRFPFTKFSILTAFTYSIFLAYGISFLISNTKHFLGNLSKHVITGIFLFFLIVFSLPAFSGHFFYEKETIIIPQDYFQVFDYFKKQDPSARIANFPQHTFWGWNFYRWGYGGSGFLWYGIRQPMLDRAFDVWSKTSENYYFELSNALYSQNVGEFKNVLEKYQVKFLLVDTNIIYSPSPKTLFYPELENMISKIPSITKAASFGNIGIYHIALESKPNTFIYTAKDMSSVVPIPNQNSDKAFRELSTYYSSFNKLDSIVYPFAQLFSKKSEKELKVAVIEKEDSIEISGTISPHLDTKSLSIASFSATENIIPIMLSRKIDDKDTTTITITITTPIVSIDGRKVYGEDIEFPIFVLPKGTTYPLSININGLRNFTVANSDKAQNIIVSSFATLNQDNSITLSSKDGFSKTYIVTANLLKSFNFVKKEIKISPNKVSQTLTIRTPKIKDEYLNFEKDDFSNSKPESCNDFRTGTDSFTLSGKTIVLKSQNASNCLTFPISNLLHDQGYAIFVESENSAGRPLHFWALNEDKKIAPLDMYFEKKNETHAFILPKMEENGRGYSLHFDNESIGHDSSINSLSRVALFHIPFAFLTEMRIQAPTQKGKRSTITTDSAIRKVTHPNESLYVVTLKKSFDKNETLILSQSYDSGWTAYSVKNSSFLTQAFPFLFGTKLDEHVMVNNWANGWGGLSVSKDQTVIIVYLPQYLEYLGFVLLAGTLITLSFKILKR